MSDDTYPPSNLLNNSPSLATLWPESCSLAISTGAAAALAAGSSSPSASTSSRLSMPGPSQVQKYKDLLIFEERLKQNLTVLKKRQQQYEAFLGLTCLLILYGLNAVFLIEPSKSRSWRFFNWMVLIVSSLTLFAFFVSGTYHRKVAVASKYVPQCNSVLRSFCMQFNRDNKGELTFCKKVPRKFQEGFERYRKLYYAKKLERARANEERNKEKGKSK